MDLPLYTKIYNGIFNLIDSWDLHTKSSKEFKYSDYITIIAENNSGDTRYAFIYMISENKELYKSATLEKIFRNIPELKMLDKKLEIIILASHIYEKYIQSLIPKLNIENKVTSRYIDKMRMLNNPTEHTWFRSVLVFRDEESINKECARIKINKKNGKYILDNFPRITVDDPLSIWVNLQVGNLIYYNKKYYICVKD